MNSRPMLYVLIVALGLAGLAGVGAQMFRHDAVAAIIGPERDADGAIVVASDEQLAEALRRIEGETTVRVKPGTYTRLAVGALPEGASLTIESADGTSPARFTSLHLRDAGRLTIRNLVFARDSSREPGQELGLIRQSDDVTLEGLVFLAPLDTPDRGREYGLMIRGSSNITVRGGQFSGTRYGLGMLGVRNVTIERNEFFDLQTDGIRGGGFTDLTITGNVLGRFHPKEGEHPDGIQLWSTNQSEPGRRIAIRDNLVARDSGGIVQGIFVRDTASKLPYEDLEITGNLVIGSMFNGISVQGVNGAVISGNEVIAYRDQRSWIRVSGGVNVAMNDNRAMLYIREGKNFSGQNNKTNRPVPGAVPERVRAWLADRPQMQSNSGRFIDLLSTAIAETDRQ